MGSGRSRPHFLIRHYNNNTNLYFTIISHTRTVVRECCKGDEASQWRKPKFDPPPATPKPLKRSQYKSAQVITSWTSTPVQKFVTIRPGVSFPRMRDFAHQNVLVFWCSCISLQPRALDGFRRKIYTPKHAVPPKDVPFRGREHKI